MSLNRPESNSLSLEKPYKGLLPVNFF